MTRHLTAKVPTAIATGKVPTVEQVIAATKPDEPTLRKARKAAAKARQETYDRELEPAAAARDAAMQPHIQARNEATDQARQKLAAAERAARQACAEAIEQARRECREATESARAAFEEATAPIDTEYRKAERQALALSQVEENAYLAGYLESRADALAARAESAP